MNRATRLAYLVVRSLQMVFWGGAATALFVARLFAEGFKARHLSRDAALLALGRAICFMLEGLGATFIKIGQIMSTRPDLLPSQIIAELVVLQEDVKPFAVDGV